MKYLVRTAMAELTQPKKLDAIARIKAEMEACREYLKLLKDDWDTCRSINSNMRAEKNAIEGYGT